MMELFVSILTALIFLCKKKKKIRCAVGDTYTPILFHFFIPFTGNFW